MDAAKHNVIGGSTPMYFLEYRFQSCHPRPAHAYGNIYLVFTWRTWAATLASAIATFIVLIAIRPVLRRSDMAAKIEVNQNIVIFPNIRNLYKYFFKIRV